MALVHDSVICIPKGAGRSCFFLDRYSRKISDGSPDEDQSDAEI
jgi:hypothetical protein